MLHRDDCRWDAVKCAHRNEVKFGSGSGWLGYSMMIPKGFEMGYTYIGQWHGGGLSSPTGAIVPGNDDVIVIKLTHLNNGWGEYFTIRGFKRGEWLDMVFHIKFSSNKKKGFFNVWANGKQQVKYRGVTCAPGKCLTSFRYGFYSSVEKGFNQTLVAYFDELRSGFSYEGVDPSRGKNFRIDLP